MPARRRPSQISADQAVALERRIQNRPGRGDLEGKNVLKEGGRLAAAQAQLEQKMNRDAVSQALDARPDMRELLGQGILQNDNMAPSLQAAARSLERSIISDNLNHMLYSRDEVEELEDQGILLARGVAPSIRGNLLKLQHQMTKDQIGHLLESRPEPEELAEKNILALGPSGVSTRVARVKKQLERNMTSDIVGHLLETRANADDLLHANILKDMSVAPAIQRVQRELEKNLARANLYHALQKRPPPQQMIERGMLGEEAFEAPPEQQQSPYEEQSYGDASSSYNPTNYQRRSRNFHLTRILLKYVATMGEAGEISLPQKGRLKDMIVDQDPTILQVAESFDADNNLMQFKHSLLNLSNAR